MIDATAFFSYFDASREGRALELVIKKREAHPKKASYKDLMSRFLIKWVRKCMKLEDAEACSTLILSTLASDMPLKIQ